MKVDRVVVDTNVLISFALTANGTAGQVVQWIANNSRLVFSTATFDELQTRLWRSKFDRYVSIEKRKQILHHLELKAAWVEIFHEVKLSRDPDDDKFIETALVAGAPVLVSGDSDLLDVQIESLEIMTPRGFYERFMGDEDGQHHIHERRGRYAADAC